MARKAKVEINDRNQELKLEIGGVFEGKFPGVYSISLNLYDPETKERTPIVALKPEGREPIRLGKGVFCNLVVYEELEARPPFEDR